MYHVCLILACLKVAAQAYNRAAQEEQSEAFMLGLTEELLGGTIRYGSNQGKIYI